MALRTPNPYEHATLQAVSLNLQFQFSGANNPVGVSGSGFTTVVRNSTGYYTVQMANAFPQVLGVFPVLALTSSYFGNVTSSFQVKADGATVSQPEQLYRGTTVSASLPYAAQTFNLYVVDNLGVLKDLPYASGSNVCFVRVDCANQGFTQG